MGPGARAAEAKNVARAEARATFFAFSPPVLREEPMGTPWGPMGTPGDIWGQGTHGDPRGIRRALWDIWEVKGTHGISCDFYGHQGSPGDPRAFWCNLEEP